MYVAIDRGMNLSIFNPLWLHGAYCYVRSRTNNSGLLGTIGSSREFQHLITNEEVDILG